MKTVMCVLGALLVLAGCNRAPEPDPHAAEATLQQQLDQQKALNQSLKTTLHDLRTEVTGKHDEQTGGTCPAGVTVVVRSFSGKTCNDYAADIAGWSEACVREGGCDTAARLTELNAAASAKCKEFCTKHNCDQSRYAPAAQCAKSVCENTGSCPDECPITNACYLKQDNEDPDCWCKDVSG